MKRFCGFQFLIGTLKTLSRALYIEKILGEFQFLIGTLKTYTGSAQICN